MSQRQLAHRAGVHHSTISRLLRGGRHPAFQTVLQLQAALESPAPILALADGPGVHPASLAAILRKDGFLADEEIAAVVELYARTIASRVAATGGGGH